MKIDINKQYQTRNGKKVRIYCTDASGHYPVHGAVWEEQTKEWNICTWTKDGKHNLDDDMKGDPFDLVEVKPRIQREYWLNIYKDHEKGSNWKTKQEADRYAFNDRIACVKIVIDCEEGEGL